jgi:hypothetical protein
MHGGEASSQTHLAVSSSHQQNSLRCAVLGATQLYTFGLLTAGHTASGAQRSLGQTWPNGENVRRCLPDCDGEHAGLAVFLLERASRTTAHVSEETRRCARAR